MKRKAAAVEEPETSESEVESIDSDDDEVSRIKILTLHHVIHLSMLVFVCSVLSKRSRKGS